MTIIKNKRKNKSLQQGLLETNYTLVYRYTLSLCKDENLAQDITQETFLKALKSKEKFSGNSKESTWLCAIAKNIWLDYLKKQGRLCEFDDSHLSENSFSIEESIADTDTAMRIHMVLHTLSEPYKEVFSLRVFGQLSFKSISEIFQKTESWARVTYHRAKKIITEKLRKDGLL